jgi:TolB protein
MGAFGDRGLPTRMNCPHARLGYAFPMQSTFFSWLVAGLQASLLSFATNAAELGPFESETDVGTVAHPGSAAYNAADQSYAITGSGENMWFATDAFHFVWKKMSGDLSLAAEVHWPATGGNAHRKACLLIRQSLDANSAYIDAALHGDGLCSLQYRETAGAPTREIQANLSGPSRLRIDKEADVVWMSIARAGKPLAPSGGSFKIHFTEPFYVGLGVCSHDNRVLEKALFSNVALNAERKPPLPASAAVESTLEVVNIASKDRRVVYHTRGVIEAPNWSRDGQSLVFNSRGHLYKIPRTGGRPQLIDTGFANHCNNDHGFSPDGKQLAISHHAEGGKSFVYLLPSGGGTPIQLTELGPSYWHGWSPDGKTVAYCAERNRNFDIYTMSVAGGPETRLTTAAGLDDGPDYTADGAWIYFNSERTGLMKLWRMRPDGQNQEQVTFDETCDWFPHPSPDGKWLVYLSYDKTVQGHPANKDILLQLRPLAGGASQILAKLFGGQGTINVSSWSPDSKQLAFVSYRQVRP